MFISKRTFNLIPKVSFNTRRHFYEGGIFALRSIRTKGIINDHVIPSRIGKVMQYHLKIQKKNIEIPIIIQNTLLLGFIFIIKLL